MYAIRSYYVKSPLNFEKEDVIAKALSVLSLYKKDIIHAEIYKTSLDARKNNDIHFVHSVIINLNSNISERKMCEQYTCCSFVENSGFSPVISNKKRDGDIVIAA